MSLEDIADVLGHADTATVASNARTNQWGLSRRLKRVGEQTWSVPVPYDPEGEAQGQAAPVFLPGPRPGRPASLLWLPVLAHVRPQAGVPAVFTIPLAVSPTVWLIAGTPSRPSVPVTRVVPVTAFCCSVCGVHRAGACAAGRPSGTRPPAVVSSLTAKASADAVSWQAGYVPPSGSTLPLALSREPAWVPLMGKPGESVRPVT